MASVQEYLGKMKTEQLEFLLAQQVNGRDAYPLSTIYEICLILSRQEPLRGTARDVFLEFAGRYADNKELSGQ